VVANLVTNAVQHTPPGTAVTVGLRTEGEVVELSVSDDGPGLAAEDATRVFERFYRADPARTRQHGGTGLGLSIVAALVAAHGGTVQVRTAPGQGATFVIRLPLHQEATAPGARDPEARDPEATDRPAAGPGRAAPSDLPAGTQS
jgi:two-component system OmpR family sensor kinase